MAQNSADILFDKFEVIDCYKKDEHSAVYLALHIYLEKKIILKALNTKTISDNSITERFKREAKILAKLNHPNIIKVLDFGMHGDYFYISYEYFEGKSLRLVLNEDQLTSQQKDNIAVQLLKGLDYAHKNDIIHRDLKPENIFVNDSIELKIGDFGLAQALNENFITHQYSIVGTPCYMSPEQIQGDALDQQSDLFSIGIVLYELYMGNNPFLGNDANDSINKIISFEEKDIIEAVSDQSESIGNLLKGLLKKRTSERIKTAHECLKYFNIESEELPPFREEKKLITYKTAFIIILILGPIITIAAFLFFGQNSGTEEKEHIPINLSENSKEEIDTTDQTPVIETKDTLDQIESGSNEISAINKSAINKIDTTSLPIKEGIITDEPEKFGVLVIECFPWAKVFIDSALIDTTPLKETLTLAEGEHEIKLINPNYPVYQTKINITENINTFVQVNLDTLLGYLDCKIFPWAELFINNESKGQTPFPNLLKLFPGNYKLTLKNDRFDSKDFQVVIKQNDTLQFKYNFEQK